jgi:hypothetical protein
VVRLNSHILAPHRFNPLFDVEQAFFDEVQGMGEGRLLAGGQPAGGGRDLTNAKRDRVEVDRPGAPFNHDLSRF